MFDFSRVVFLILNLLFHPGNCDSPLGMSSGTIEDSQLTASSYSKNFKVTSKEHQDMKPKYGRLNNHFAWCTDESHGSWLKVSLHRIAMVTGLASQGYKNDFNHYYVREYQLQYSTDDKNWKYLTENSGTKV